MISRTELPESLRLSLKGRLAAVGQPDPLSRRDRVDSGDQQKSECSPIVLIGLSFGNGPPDNRTMALAPVSTSAAASSPLHDRSAIQL